MGLSYRMGIFLGAVLCVFIYFGNPKTTRLPDSPQAISTVQKQLDKLSPEDRQLVVDYIKRANGTVLPEQFADPDDPLTARTFSDAIKLQRKFNLKQAADKGRAKQLANTRESAFEPLREVLQVELLKREIVTVDQFLGRQPVPGQATNDRKVLVTTLRFSNYENESITYFSGTVEIRTRADPDSFLNVVHCYVEHHTVIPGSMTVDLDCGSANRPAGSFEETFAYLPERDLILSWAPRKIVLHSGKTLESGF